MTSQRQVKTNVKPQNIPKFIGMFKTSSTLFMIPQTGNMAWVNQGSLVLFGLIYMAMTSCQVSWRLLV